MTLVHFFQVHLESDIMILKSSYTFDPKISLYKEWHHFNLFDAKNKILDCLILRLMETHMIKINEY